MNSETFEKARELIVEIRAMKTQLAILSETGNAFCIPDEMSELQKKFDEL